MTQNILYRSVNRSASNLPSEEDESDGWRKINGYRTSEPMTNATEHINLMLFMPRKCARTAQQLLRRVFLLEQHRNIVHEDSTEAGAEKHRIKFNCLSSKATRDEGIDEVEKTVGYFSKYVFKGLNRDEFEQVEDTDIVVPMRGRDEAWASVFGIRQFQFFGTESISTYRAVRSISKKRMMNAEFRNKLPQVFIEAWAAAMGIQIIKNAGGKIVNFEDDGEFTQKKVDYHRFLQLTETSYFTSEEQVHIEIFNRKRHMTCEDRRVTVEHGISLVRVDEETGEMIGWREDRPDLLDGLYSMSVGEPGRYGQDKPGKDLYLKILPVPADQAEKNVILSLKKMAAKHGGYCEQLEADSIKIDFLKKDWTECTEYGGPLSHDEIAARLPMLSLSKIQDMVKKAVEKKAKTAELLNNISTGLSQFAHLFKDKTKW